MQDFIGKTIGLATQHDAKIQVKFLQSNVSSFKAEVQYIASKKSGQIVRFLYLTILVQLIIAS